MTFGSGDASDRDGGGSVLSSSWEPLAEERAPAGDQQEETAIATPVAKNWIREKRGVFGETAWTRDSRALDSAPWLPWLSLYRKSFAVSAEFGWTLYTVRSSLQLQLQLGAFIWCPWTRGSQPKYVVSPTEVGCAMARRRQRMRWWRKRIKLEVARCEGNR